MTRLSGQQKLSYKTQCWQEDSIQEWIGLSFAESQSAAHDQHKWQLIVRESSAVPPQPPLPGVMRLRMIFMNYEKDPYTNKNTLINLETLTSKT